MSHAMGQLAVGKWRDHFSYNKAYRIDNAGDRIYCSASGALFYYDLEDYTVNKVSKTTILNDVGISTFSYDPQTHYLAIAYNNANLDFIKDNAATSEAIKAYTTYVSTTATPTWLAASVLSSSTWLAWK